jgi:hypothetical protein
MSEMEMWKEETLKEIERAAEDNIVILTVTRRSSEGFYNYKTETLYVVFKRKDAVPYEEMYIRRPVVIELTTGVFQPFSEEELTSFISRLRRKGFSVKRIPLM